MADVDYHGVQYADGANAQRAVNNDDSHNLEQGLLELQMMHRAHTMMPLGSHLQEPRREDMAL